VVSALREQKRFFAGRPGGGTGAADDEPGEPGRRAANGRPHPHPRLCVTAEPQGLACSRIAPFVKKAKQPCRSPAPTRTETHGAACPPGAEGAFSTGVDGAQPSARRAAGLSFATGLASRQWQRRRHWARIRPGGCARGRLERPSCNAARPATAARTEDGRRAGASRRAEFLRGARRVRPSASSRCAKRCCYSSI